MERKSKYSKITISAFIIFTYFVQAEVRSSVNEKFNSKTSAGKTIFFLLVVSTSGEQRALADAIITSAVSSSLPFQAIL